MMDYYSNLGVRKNANMHEVVDKLVLFLSHVRDETANLKNEEEKGEVLSSALAMVQDVCRIFLTPKDKEKYDVGLQEQRLISSKLYKIKSNVVPLNNISSKPKSFWFRLITNLIPQLEHEKQMLFLNNNDDIQDIITFIIDNSHYANLDVSQRHTFIPLEIIKQSFDVAQSRKRRVVRVEDIVKAINDCEYLDKGVRSGLAVIVFEKWYKSPNQVEPTYKKTL